ncbi:ABC transporter permease [Chitinophaga sp. GCM10012297]|uniref:ABC transporter permease n=1 Tax=Chitinophaga chungangae TaxID=2821488 RepID=A0ABS3YDB7_9BACT|nr:ABC transporter permease [Chitinophaga chungangae]MBO9152683.1 ABC transporter permease [Chitinophaga chungangae]
MIRNYIKVAMRHLMRNKGITVINIAGLAIGMACCILIVLFIKDELSYNGFHKDASSIYRLNSLIKDKNWTGQMGISQFGAAPNLRQELSRVKETVRFYEVHEVIVSAKNEEYRQEKTVFADAGFFSMFSFPLLSGNPATVLKDPYTVVLTENTAKKFFGNENPIGKVIRIQDDYDCYVTGVAKAAPANSDLQFEMVMSFSTYMQNAAKAGFNPEENWFGFTSNYTFVRLPDGVTGAALAGELKQFADKYVGPSAKTLGNEFNYRLQPLTDIHLYPDGDTDKANYVSRLYIYGWIGFFIILIACINFMNLVTARGSERAVEVGLRKVMGAERKTLISQFLVESVIISLLAFAFAVLVAAIVLPGFNFVTDKTMALFGAANIMMFAVLLLIAITVGLLAGSYPALYLSGFVPVRILKGDLATSGHRSLFRKTLVVSQFTIALVLIIATVVMYTQLRYMREKDLGYNKQGLMTFYLNNNKQAPLRNTFKTEMTNLPFVKHAAYTNMPLGGQSASNNPVGLEGAREDESISAIVIHADFNYFTNIGARFVAGRDFSEKFPSDSLDAYVINEAAVKKLGLKDPVIGSRIVWRGTSVPRPGKVIGVVQDFNMQTLRLPIEPMVSLIRNNRAGMLTIRLADGDRQAQLAQIESVWKRLMPAFPFNYRFVENELGNQYLVEQRSGSLFGAYACLAVIIACLGLFGLAMLVARQRTKEIGIRKVLGASVSSITALLSKDFLQLVAIAIVISAPLAWFGMNKWLAEFPFRTPFPWWAMVAAGLLALVVAFLTISFQSVKAALLNPVRSLRSE